MIDQSHHDLYLITSPQGPEHALVRLPVGALYWRRRPSSRPRATVLDRPSWMDLALASLGLICLPLLAPALLKFAF